MLVSLAIRNFVLIEDAEIRFGPGLTVLTGETGAGKTLLTRALGLLVGERAEGGMVGQRGDDAMVQAVFEVEEALLKDIPEDIRELAALEPGEIIVTRRLSRQGRNRCYINDAAVTLASLGQVTGGLLSFSGQHEHRRLLDPAFQLAVLDEWAGEKVLQMAQDVAAAVSAAQATERRLRDIQESREARLREIDLLRFQVDELEEAGLSVDEEEGLLVEQRRLARAEDILRHAGDAADLLASEDEHPDAASLLAQAADLLEGLAGVDPTLDGVAAGLTEMRYQTTEWARELRSFIDGVAVDPGRLQEVDERLRRYTDLGRKYGGGTVEAAAYLERAATELQSLERSEEDLTGLRETLDQQRETALEAAGRLSAARRAAAPRLEQAVAGQLADLRMQDTRLEVSFQPRDGWEGLRTTGAESVEFLLAAGQGAGPRSLARTASGGEMSRILLALKCALVGGGGGETMVLDEVDAGIGGRTAAAVGLKIRELASYAQVIVVTHLPQVAALADHNYVVHKSSDDGSLSTGLKMVEGEALVEELCRMMGSHPDDAEAMAHARRLRERAGETS